MEAVHRAARQAVAAPTVIGYSGRFQCNISGVTSSDSFNALSTAHISAGLKMPLKGLILSLQGSLSSTCLVAHSRAHGLSPHDIGMLCLRGSQVKHTVATQQHG